MYLNLVDCVPHLAKMAFSAYSSTRRRSLCCSMVGDADATAAAAAAVALQVLMQLPLGLDGTSRLLAGIAACLLLPMLLLLLFLAGLLLGLRSRQLSRLLRSMLGLLGSSMLCAVGLLGSLLLSAWLLAGQATRAGLAGEQHAACRLAGQAVGVAGSASAPSACCPQVGEKTVPVSAASVAAVSSTGNDSLLTLVDVLPHVSLVSSLCFVALLLVPDFSSAETCAATAVPGAAGILEGRTVAVVFSALSVRLALCS